MSMLPKIPLLDTLREASREDIRSDVSAGITTAIMLVPQGMAYAMLAGLEPIVGLYASTVPVLIYALLGTSRQLAVGPVAMVSLLVAGSVAPLAGGDPVVFGTLAAALALLVGLIQWGMGVLRIGAVVKLLSHPVVAGFTSAAALVIAASQLKHVLGFNIPRSHHLYEILWHAVTHLGETNPVTFAVAAASLAALVIMKRLSPRLPRFLLVVVGGALTVRVLGLTEVGVSIVGEVPAGLPAPAVPMVSGSQLLALLPAAITISLVGFMESISVATAYARKHRYELDANRELQGLGLANVGSAFFGGYPVTGGFSRTAVNDQAGARTGLAGVVTASVVTITLLFLTPLFHDLPKAVLAAIIMSAVLGLVAVDEARHLWHSSRSDLGLMALTFVATLVVGIEQGIAVGVAASLVLFVWQTSAPHVAVLGRMPGTEIYRKLERNPEALAVPGVLLVRVDAPLFFANTAFLLQTVRGLLSEGTRAVVLDCSGIGSVDASGVGVVAELAEELELAGIELWLASARGPVRDMLAHGGVVDSIGQHHVVQRVHDAVTELTRVAEVA